MVVTACSVHHSQGEGLKWSLLSGGMNLWCPHGGSPPNWRTLMGEASCRDPGPTYPGTWVNSLTLYLVHKYFGLCLVSAPLHYISVLGGSNGCRYVSLILVHLVYWGLTPQQQPGSYQGGEMMMMNSVFWWRKPEYPEETTDLRQVTDETVHTYSLCPVRGLNLGLGRSIGLH